MSASLPQPPLEPFLRERARRALFFAGAFFFSCLGWSGHGRAHSVGISRGDYSLNGAEIVAVVAFSRAEVALALPSLDQAGVLDARGKDRVERWSLAGLRFSSEHGSCPGTLSRAAFTENDGLTLWLRYECIAPPRELTFDASFLRSVSSGHRHVMHLSFGKASADSVIDQSASVLHIAVPDAAHGGPTVTSRWARFRVFFVMGLGHILSGYDHLTFLFGLLLVLGPVRSLLWAITAFTVAHSLTLSLASLGLATPSPSWIEPLIAASIVYVGMENRFVPNAVGRWRITFCFGLIHGFGFAGALREISMPRSELPLALFSFNLGVEAGQLAIVAIVLPGLIHAHRRGWLSMQRARLLSLGVSAMGIYWLISRLVAAA